MSNKIKFNNGKKYYELQKKIGTGSFANVYKSYLIIKNKNNNYDNKIVAIKRINKNKLSKKLEENLESEINILQTLKHNNIVAFYGLEKTKTHIYLELEYCEGSDLHKLLRQQKNLSTIIVRRLLKQLSLGIKFLYQNNFIHRDLKPQNLLLTTKNLNDILFNDKNLDYENTYDYNNDLNINSNVILKIADFGFARHLGKYIYYIIFILYNLLKLILHNLYFLNLNR